MYLDIQCPTTKRWPDWINTITGWYQRGKQNFTYGRVPKLRDIPYKSGMWGVDNYTNVSLAGECCIYFSSDVMLSFGR